MRRGRLPPPPPLGKSVMNGVALGSGPILPYRALYANRATGTPTLPSGGRRGLTNWRHRIAISTRCLLAHGDLTSAGSWPDLPERHIANTTNIPRHHPTAPPDQRANRRRPPTDGGDGPETQAVAAARDRTLSEPAQAPAATTTLAARSLPLTGWRNKTTQVRPPTAVQRQHRDLDRRPLCR